VSGNPAAERPKGIAATLKALLQRLERSQWMEQSDIVGAQHRELAALAAHCAKHSPYFRARLESAGLEPDDLGTPEGLARLPPFGRRDLQSASGFYCDAIPEGHGPVTETRTSGSTGEPVCVRRTGFNGLYWHAFTLREHFWHGRNVRSRVCAVRANVSEIVRAPDWGRPATFLFETGPSLIVPVTTAIDRLFDLIVEFAPAILLAYPSILSALIREGEARGVRIESIRHLRSVGETVSPALRADARRYFGLRIADSYSSQEMGFVAAQCPGTDAYHAMAEGAIVEILRKDGSPCPPGEAGRIVVSDLRNYATPMIRYDIGDWAAAGAPCACGRGLPALARIFGRERNLILMPDGSRHWPLVGFDRFREIAPVSQYQFIQTDRQNIEVRLVVERPLGEGEERALAVHMQKALGHPFALHFAYYEDAIPAGAGGKFEEFICRASDSRA
jgi:phenylacetate-coenzyme A ligase PaaK-like adenylate-forming protein